MRTQYGGEGQGIWYLHPLQYLHCSAVLCYVCHPPWLVKDKHHIAMVLCHVPNVCLQFWSGELDDRKISWGTNHNPQRPVSTICKCLQVGGFSAQLTVHPIVYLPTHFLLTSHCSYSSKSGCKTIMMMDFFGHNLGIKCYILVFWFDERFTLFCGLRPTPSSWDLASCNRQLKQENHKKARWTWFTLFGDSWRSDPGWWCAFPPIQPWYFSFLVTPASFSK